SEIAKGKRTTMREKHAGEGVFFTSRAFDEYAILANGVKYSYFSENDDWTMGESSVHVGTKVIMRISKNSSTRLDEIYKKYTSPDELNFDIGGRFNVNPFT